MRSLLPILSIILSLMTKCILYGQDSWTDLENRHAIISHIEISVLPVFNLQNPQENHFIGRWANFIHIETHANSILPALIFKEGEPVNKLQIEASERLLRSLPFVRDAVIMPSENSDGTVSAIVKIHDAWSLKLSMTLHYIGGESEWSVMAREYNLLGLGKQIQLGYQKTIDRTFTDFAYQDPFFLHSRWLLFTQYRQLSDGIAWHSMLNHPFYDVRSPWAAGAAANSSKSIQTYYEKGEPFFAMSAQQNSLSLFYHFMVWQHDKTAQRLGLEWQANGYRYNPIKVFKPDPLPNFDSRDRQFQGIMGFWQFFQDDYIQRRNINFMGKVEDFNLGWDVQLRGGYFPESLGSSWNAVYHEGFAGKGISFDKYCFLSANVQWQSVSEESGPTHIWSQAMINFFDQHLPRQTIMLAFGFIHSTHPFPEDLTYLGGIDGLRGYMNYFRLGKQRWMFTVEDRVFTSWNFLGLVELGFVAYLDAGSIREFSTGRWSKPYASVGAGLRIGNLKSSFGRVITISVATPIVREPGVKGIQIIIGAG